MWTDWTHTAPPPDPPSVLEKFPRAEARKMVRSVLNSLTGDIYPGLEEEADVLWSLEVLKFGLTVSPCDETVTACADLYSSWLSSLLPSPSSTVPRAIRRDRDHMGRLMMRQVRGLFTNIDLTTGDPDTVLERSCLSVLEVLERVGQHCGLLEVETVSCLLELLLEVSDLVLSQPGSSSLSHSLLSVLTHCWLAASAQSQFPSPSLWAGLVRLARGWRHRLELVVHWSNINLHLLSLQLNLPTHHSSYSDPCQGLTRERLVQVSFRFLHLLGNVVDLTQEQSVRRSPGLVRADRLHPERVTESLQHLPVIFHKAVSLLSRLVDGYLGISNRPRVSTLLHMFGQWLFQASLLDTPFSGLQEQSLGRFSEGRAEALRTLCVIFNSKRYSEEVEETYLARFYLAIEYGLKAPPGVQLSSLQYFGQLMTSNLPGSNILLPQLIAFLLRSLKDSKEAERDRCVVEILKSVHCLPLHFRDMTPVRFLKEDRAVRLEDSIEDIFQSLVLFLEREDELRNCRVVVCIMASYMEAHKERSGPWAASLLDIVCRRLTSSWGSDFSTCLVALELIIFVSSTKPDLPEEVTRTVLHTLCQFVVLQCSKPPPAHSKDLHSSVILAFQTVARWLLSFPLLLHRPESRRKVLEITELAMSGSRSEKELKEEKAPSPVSLRVSRAAEELLSSVMTTVGFSPGTSLCEKASTSLSEETVLTGHPTQPPCDGFKYYFCDKNFLLAVSKQSGAGTIAILRSASGKTVWKFGQTPARHSPHLPAQRKVDCKIQFSRPEPRSLNLNNRLPALDTGLRPCKADRTVPELEELAEDEMEDLVTRQAERERSVRSGPRLVVTASEPGRGEEDQEWRLLVSQLGLLDQMLSDDPEDCTELDSSSPQFWPDLRSLDSLNTRTVQTLCVYYVRRGQHGVSSILANSLSSNLPASFLSLLSGLGWQVQLHSHKGWDGQAKTESHILYWADDLTELAILVPCQPILSHSSSGRRSRTPTEGRVLLVWLESPEDRETFPHTELVSEAVSLIIFLSALDCGLVRAVVTTRDGQERNVAPLVSGLVTSQSVLPLLVRQTTLNVCRRERLEADTSQQVRRSALLNIKNKYAVNNNNTADNIQSLFL